MNQQETAELLNEMIQTGMITLKHMSKILSLNYVNLSKFRNGYFNYAPENVMRIRRTLLSIKAFYESGLSNA
jgi:hypothetical protein